MASSLHPTIDLVGRGFSLRLQDSIHRLVYPVQPRAFGSEPVGLSFLVFGVFFPSRWRAVSAVLRRRVDGSSAVAVTTPLAESALSDPARQRETRSATAPLSRPTCRRCARPILNRRPCHAVVDSLGRPLLPFSSSHLRDIVVAFSVWTLLFMLPFGFALSCRVLTRRLPRCCCCCGSSCSATRLFVSNPFPETLLTEFHGLLNRLFVASPRFH